MQASGSRHETEEVFSSERRKAVLGMSHHCADPCLPSFHEVHGVQFREMGFFNNISLKQLEIGPLPCIVGSQWHITMTKVNQSEFVEF